MKHSVVAFCRPLDSRFVRAVLLALGQGISGHAAEGEALYQDPPFTIQKQDQTSWLISPGGERFFSLGVCCVNQGVSRGEFDPANPGYGAWQHYADSNQWANATLRRLKAWGFTTIGGWSDFATLSACSDAQVAFTPVLHMGSTAGAP